VTAPISVIGDWRGTARVDTSSVRFSTPITNHESRSPLMKHRPEHIAIIMDGNGRWAAERDLPRSEGHRQGAETITRIVRAARDRGIRHLTLYAFSEENWSRPTEEVRALMELICFFLVWKRDELVAEGTEFRVIGDVDRLPPEVRQEIERTMAATKGGERMSLNVALSYGGRQEICRAVEKLLEAKATTCTAEAFAAALDTAGLPDPDLLIRTSGEYRVSNFLLWQLAYTELYFTETLWPDFDEAALDEALASYAQRRRRFGLTDAQLKG
jgi:undecaprenyl diphosphate synthase